MTEQTIPFEPNIILKAYAHAFFPMGNPDNGEIEWFRPKQRAIFDIYNFHISKSLKKTLKKKKYSLEINRQFKTVMKLCAKRDEGSWITDEMIEVYEKIHKMGFAHSIEIHMDSHLAGGLYGISINGAFFGESMFHRTKNASKIALCELIFLMRKKQMVLLDAQFETPHLKTFNLKLVPDSKYYSMLQNAINQPVSFI